MNIRIEDVMVVIRWLVLWSVTSRKIAILFYALWWVCILAAYCISTVRDLDYDYAFSVLMIVSWLIMIILSAIFYPLIF